MSHFAYLLRCADGSFYAGYTVDLSRRLAAHQAGKASKCTRARRPVELVYWEEYASKGDALSREAELKKLGHQAKSELVVGFKTIAD
ncbi:MAG: GIY-YIG nuclease family protein [Peptococcaceae bacterium]|nr:GIY-YIG nuclease family protein [Peptococcaceae bacterium]